MSDPQQVNSLSQILLDESQKLVNDPSDDLWETEPVLFRRFVTDSFYLNLPNLTDLQSMDCEMLLGMDPKKIFTEESMYNLFILVAGKGSGKDYMASIVIIYCFYVLLCMKSPHKFLDWPIGESIDILVVSYSDEQALLGPFDKVRQRLLNCMWFKNHFTIILGDKGAINPKGKREIMMHRDKIITFNNVRILSEHSKNEAFEGYNVLFFLMSEACLRGRSPITLEDGTKMSIAEIVNNKLPVKVFSKNFQTGKIEARKVVNWFKYLRKSELLKIRVGHSDSQNTAHLPIMLLRHTPLVPEIEIFHAPTFCH